ncbi:hypothetical protein GCM10028825_23870 [Spirosoma agri]
MNTGSDSAPSGTRLERFDDEFDYAGQNLAKLGAELVGNYIGRQPGLPVKSGLADGF